MDETQDPVCNVTEAVCDGLRRIGEFSYAILPKNLAHACADLEKAVLTELRGCLDWQIRLVDECIAGGDRLREEWRAKYQRPTESPSGTAV